ncbi:MAG: recombination-associated protein RdgC [Planctomycetes bacterium]|nr:recombination-associated protein RdgC [Planctomycetota bacterium]
MAAIRKSGGVVPFYWQGKILDPRDDDFAEALATQRFRTIENAASEEVSTGWVTPADPTGDSFAVEDLDGGVGTWLRFRTDKKSMPMKWLQIHRDAAEKARGKKLSAKERRELKEDLMDQLLPRVLPTISLVDALLFHERKTVLLFATSKSAKEAFAKLFFETFTVQLETADPLQSGLRADLSPDQKHALERLEPIRWPNASRDQGDAPPIAAAAAAAGMPREVEVPFEVDEPAAEAVTEANDTEDSR